MKQLPNKSGEQISKPDYYKLARELVLQKTPTVDSIHTALVTAHQAGRNELREGIRRARETPWPRSND